MPRLKSMPADRPITMFITGTDTGVGKTLVAAALARYVRRCGLRVAVMKPCETGVSEPSRLGADGELLRWAAGSEDDINLISPYRLPAPLSPAQAAEQAGVRIDPGVIAEACATLARDTDLLLVEGAGGLMVPLRGGYLMADLARQLQMPLLVVSRPTLGTINHTLLTIFAARCMELPVAGFLVNRMPAEPGPAEREAPHMLASLASAEPLGVLPEVDGTPMEQIEQLADAVSRSPSRFWLHQALGLDPGTQPL
jgi:dethiobiotin synthetase